MSQKADPNGLKQCPRCGEWKVRKDGFTYRPNHGWQSQCRVCILEKYREWLYKKRGVQSPAKYRLAPEGTKYCSRCDKYLPFDQFYRTKGEPTTPCKECRKVEYRIKREGKPTRVGFHHGKPAMTEEEKAEKRRHYSYQKNLQKRGYEPIHTLEEWQALLDRTGRKCIKCGVPEEYTPITRDHIMPLSEGGTDEIWNIQPLCLRCNGKKHTKLTDYRGNTWVGA